MLKLTVTATAKGTAVLIQLWHKKNCSGIQMMCIISKRIWLHSGLGWDWGESAYQQECWNGSTQERPHCLFLHFTPLFNFRTMLHTLKKIKTVSAKKTRQQQCWWEHKMAQLLGKTAWQFCKRSKTVTTHPTDSTPGSISMRNENKGPYKDLYLNVHSSIAPNSQKKVNNPNILWWINKMCHAHTTDYSTINSETIMLSKRSQSQKTTCLGILFITGSTEQANLQTEGRSVVAEAPRRVWGKRRIDYQWVWVGFLKRFYLFLFSPGWCGSVD